MGSERGRASLRPLSGSCMVVDCMGWGQEGCRQRNQLGGSSEATPHAWVHDQGRGLASATLAWGPLSPWPRGRQSCAPRAPRPDDLGSEACPEDRCRPG